MGVRQINPSRINKFRNFLYSTSSATFGAGNLISLNVYSKELRGIRSLSLNTARLTSDLKSLSVGGQGFTLRAGRRVTGRLAGKIGQSIIPQNMGFLSRMANNYYGRNVGREVQQYFNKKTKIQAYINGYEITNATKKAIQQTPRLQGQYSAAKLSYKNSGVSLSEYNPVNLLFDIQAYMVGLNAGTGNAPIESGSLIKSINLREFRTDDPEGLVTGSITVGSSEGNNGDVADLAPYWWKTTYAGAFYDLRKFGINNNSQWINASKPYWWGNAVLQGIKKSLPKRLEIATKHFDGWNYQFRPQSALSVKYLQPKIPTGGYRGSFELSARNVTSEDYALLQGMGYEAGV